MMETQKERKRRIWYGHIIPWMVVLFCLLVMAAVAIPDFLKFNSKGPEIKMGFRSIYKAQVKYFEKHHRYAGGKNCFKELNWKPEGRMYTYYCGEDKIVCTLCKKECVTPNLSAVSERGFTIMASGNIDNDPTCDVWTINDAKVRKNVVNDAQK